MNATPAMDWVAQNQGRLVQEFAVLHRRLGDAEPQPIEEPGGEPMMPPAAIDTLAGIFQLSRFERELLLLCAGVEMDFDLGGALRRGQWPTATRRRHVFPGDGGSGRSALERARSLGAAAPLSPDRDRTWPRPDGGAAAHRRAHPALPGRGQPAGPAARRRAVEPDPVASDGQGTFAAGDRNDPAGSRRPARGDGAAFLWRRRIRPGGYRRVDRRSGGSSAVCSAPRRHASGRRRDGSVCSVMDARGEPASGASAAAMGGRHPERGRPPAGRETAGWADDRQPRSCAAASRGGAVRGQQARSGGAEASLAGSARAPPPRV